jgi:catalase
MSSNRSGTMAKKRSDGENSIEQEVGNGGETHQSAGKSGTPLTTDQGLPIADNQNSLRVGPRGPGLLEDFILREKITNFDHERIPERVVHARGFGVHGYFQSYENHSKLTKAHFLSDPKLKTPVFVRFSTVAGSRGSFDTARDVRGFAVKFYTQEGNYDLVGNNMPVFFIQDAIKFPDLIHSVKPEPDSDIPQAQSAHDTFWDFVSLTPESTHMLMWVMSDRGIPRSYRMMEGFGVHTFRMIDAKGRATFVKFHWRPKHGTFSLVWDEAVQINGADPDFHRRDMWNAILDGDFPEYELSVQAFSEEQAAQFDFDVLDPTKIVPEELVPLKPLGKMVLDRLVDNFHDETEQVAFCPSHVVPGIDFSNDPLLQGRLFSYLDTQLSRLGSPNFHQLPINAAKCPVENLQRDGHMQMLVHKGRVSYEPNSLDPRMPREDHRRGFSTFPAPEQGDKTRLRPESFADHYSQALLFLESMTDPERRHMAAAFAFELGKCKTLAVRRRMLGRLNLVDSGFSDEVATLLGMEGEAEKLKPAMPVKSDVEPSIALSQLLKAPQTIAGRRIGLLITDGVSDRIVASLKKQLKAEGATVCLVAPKVGGATTKSGKKLEADEALAGAPSCLFDAVVVAPSGDGAEELAATAAAVEWVRNAFAHLKVIGFTPEALPLLESARVAPDADAGTVAVKGDDFGPFIAAAKMHRIWDREAKVKPAKTP